MVAGGVSRPGGHRLPARSETGFRPSGADGMGGAAGRFPGAVRPAADGGPEPSQHPLAAGGEGLRPHPPHECVVHLVPLGGGAQYPHAQGRTAGDADGRFLPGVAGPQGDAGRLRRRHPVFPILCQREAAVPADGAPFRGRPAAGRVSPGGAERPVRRHGPGVRAPDHQAVGRVRQEGAAGDPRPVRRPGLERRRRLRDAGKGHRHHPLPGLSGHDVLQPVPLFGELQAQCRARHERRPQDGLLRVRRPEPAVL